ncbi:MAG: HAMP domain-containing histidine kinase, partial [Algicola sp.]|nr:HAMP domain-containing histidine kinase [Algicola sp.]
MIKIFSPELSVKEQLLQLVKLRIFYLLTEIVVVGVGQTQFDSDLPWHYLWKVVFAHIALTGVYYSYTRIKEQISPHYLFQTILIDILAFSSLLYFSGGATNGAVSVLLLPVATAAALFNWRLSLLLAAVAIISYTTLMYNYWPVAVDPHAHHQMQQLNQQAQGFSFHLLGMWLTFIFSCLLLVWFIGQQSHAVRVKHQSLSALLENQLRDEQLIAIATFAANAAHDLATPLSSISLLCDELKHDVGKEGLDTLIEQVELCRTIVQSISHKAILNKSNISQSENVDDYFATLVERWLVTRPDIVLDFEQSDGLQKRVFNPDAGLESALTNILDNAADASIGNGANKLDLSIILSINDEIELKINDFGRGIDDELIEALGKEPVQSNQNGMGFGQFFANATIGRF